MKSNKTRQTGYLRLRCANDEPQTICPTPAKRNGKVTLLNRLSKAAPLEAFENLVWTSEKEREREREISAMPFPNVPVKIPNLTTRTLMGYAKPPIHAHATG